MKARLDIHTLPVQMIAAFIAVVLMTAAAVGLPAIWLLRNQLDRLAWSQVERGQRIATALYATKSRESENLATLTAQRPTLKELLQQGEFDRLGQYLQTLQQSTGLALIAICSPEDELIVTTESRASSAICQQWPLEVYQYDPATHQAYLTAQQLIADEAVPLGTVLVGSRLDADFAAQIEAETGLEHTLWLGTTRLGSSITALPQSPVVVVRQDASQRIFEIDDTRYYAINFMLGQSDLSAEVALDVSEILVTQNRLGGWIAAAIIGVSLAVSALGVLLARHISSPLVSLAGSAEALSRGDLNSTVDTHINVREVAQVARALETARTDLLQTLTSLENEKTWIEHLLASIVEGIMTLDERGHITFFSHGAERITGWPRAEVLGRSCDDVFRLAEGQQTFRQMIPMPGRRIKADVVLSDGQIASLAITGAELTPWQSSEDKVVIVFRDISEEETIHRILGQFLANVAHEFRTPLSALAASIELLLDQAPLLSQAEVEELLVSLHLGILSLQTLVDNLLESASIEAGRFNVRPRRVDIGHIVAEAVQTMQPLLTKYEQNLVLQLPVARLLVRADARRVIQVLNNLLSNASRYCPPGTEILLRVTQTPTEARVEVADRGPGIPPEARSDIFRRFIFPEADARTSKAGAGLGLSVVKAVVEAHEGQVGVDANPGGGAVFWFTLPLDQEAA